MADALRWMREKEMKCRFYVGTFQNSFTQYYYAYRHCRWLEENVRTDHSTVWFYDYVGKYMQNFIPRNELQRMFNVFGSGMTDDFKQDFRELIGSLLDNNFNIAAAARQSFMHKNTFVYRYNKVRDMLNVNPQASLSDKWMLMYLYIYLMP